MTAAHRVRRTPLVRRVPAAVRVLLLAILAPYAAAQTMEVRMLGEQFVPAQISVRAGTTVRWINAEKRTSHSLIFPEEGTAETDRLFPGESWQRTFQNPGRYPYVCGPHPEMKGVVVVTP